MPIVDPHSWEVLPFGDQTGFIDFLGQHELQHREFASVIRAGGFRSYPLLPLGDGGDPAPLRIVPSEDFLFPFGEDRGDTWHQAHQLVHQGETTSLLIAAPSDFTSYDLSDPNDFATWAFLHALQHVTIRKVLGL